MKHLKNKLSRGDEQSVTYGSDPIRLKEERRWIEVSGMEVRERILMREMKRYTEDKR